MTCLTADGTLTGAVLDLLDLLVEPLAAEAAARHLDRPLDQVRASLLEMADAGLVERGGELYRTTAAGRARAAR
jgi:predicted transcriptional regulator